MELLAYGPSGYGDELLGGLLITLVVAVSSFLGALVLGAGFSLLALSPKKPLQLVWRVYRSVLMSLPSLLVIFFVYFNAPTPIGALGARSPDISPLAAGIVALTLVYAAYVAEVLRGSVLNVPWGQSEAAISLGIRPWPRWRSIILPQAVRLALPGLGNIWMIMIKDTALVSLVGLSDIVRQATVAANSTQRPFLFYFATLAAFLLIAGLSHAGIRRLEQDEGSGQAAGKGLA